MSFYNALVNAGLRPREIVPDGQIRRCATDDKPRSINGWYVLHPNNTGAFGNWATDLNATWKDEHAQIDRAEQTKRQRQYQQQRQAEQQRRKAAISACRQFFAKAQPMQAVHPYLEAKGLSNRGCGALRIAQDKLLIPAYYKQQLMTVQTIAPDGQKRFWTGAPKRGASFALSRPRAAMTCFVEGFATGLAVYQALNHAQVVVCFDAGNILPVMDAIQPTGNVVICADNDHETEVKTGINTGVKTALDVAKRFGCGVAYPKDIKGSDWADAALEWGDVAKRRIQLLIQAQSAFVEGCAM